LNGQPALPCPATRPRAGTPCTNESQLCEYTGDLCYTPELSLGPTILCQNGAWRGYEAIANCPAFPHCPM
jgi:hypothetical protein